MTAANRDHPGHDDENVKEQDDVFDLHTKHSVISCMVNKTLLGLLCGSLGFGLSQLTIATTVRAHDVEISNLRTAFKEERERTDARIFQLVEQIKEQNRMNSALLSHAQSLIVQNERVLSLLAAHLGIKAASGTH